MNAIKQKKQAFLYILIGGLAFSAEYISFIVFVNGFVGVPIVIAQTVSFSIGLVISFLGNRKFTFSNNSDKFAYTKKVQFIIYLSLALINLIITNLLIHYLVNSEHILPWLAKIITMFSVIIWNFIIFQKVIFKKEQLFI